MPSTAPDSFAGIPARTGHFQYESGHHGDLWLDLDALFTDPMQTELFAAALSSLLVDLPIQVVCGAMTGGALLAQTVARILGLHFVYTERHVVNGHPVYLLPTGQQSIVDGKRIALVDDVINAGSATSATYRAVVDAGGIPVAIGALLVLGEAIDDLAAEWSVPVLTLQRHPNNLWHPDECPLCQTGAPLVSTS